MGRRPQPGPRGFDRGLSLELSYKLSKVWRVHVWQNLNEKTDFHVQLFIGLFRHTRSRQTFDT